MLFTIHMFFVQVIIGENIFRLWCTSSAVGTAAAGDGLKRNIIIWFWNMIVDFS